MQQSDSLAQPINLRFIIIIALIMLILSGCSTNPPKPQKDESLITSEQHIDVLFVPGMGMGWRVLLIRPLNSFKRHILHTDLGSKKQRALDYSAASTYDHRQRHVISPWYAPELSNR